MKYPKDSYMTCHGMRIKVQEVLGDLRFVSTNCGYDKDHWEDFSAGTRTVGELERGGWIEEPVKWEPAKGDKYYYIEDVLTINWNPWHDIQIDKARKNGFGIYRTEEEAQAVADKIKEFMKTIV